MSLGCVSGWVTGYTQVSPPPPRLVRFGLSFEKLKSSHWRGNIDHISNKDDKAEGRDNLQQLLLPQNHDPDILHSQTYFIVLKMKEVVCR